MIYLDHAATTPIDPEVREVMLPFLDENFGNPSSVYGVGRQARATLDSARDRVAAALGCESRELIFTSGGSESDNLAIRGVARRNRDRGRHLICSQVEHHAVLHTMQDLERDGFEVTYLPVDKYGQVNQSDLEAALRDDTLLVSIMIGNNEVGTIEPVGELAAVTHEKSAAYFHTDAVQAFGKIPIRVDELGVDLLSISAHKIYGPKGVGCLYVRMGTRIQPLITGGGHERNRRAGTENVAGIAGLAKAVEIAVRDFEQDTRHLATMQSRLLEGVMTAISGPGVEGDSLLMLLDRHEVYASSGSACTSGSLEPSHVLLAMGIGPQEALGSLRLTVGKHTPPDAVDRAVEVIRASVEQLHNGSLTPARAC